MAVRIGTVLLRFRLTTAWKRSDFLRETNHRLREKGENCTNADCQQPRFAEFRHQVGYLLTSQITVNICARNSLARHRLALKRQYSSM